MLLILHEKLIEAGFVAKALKVDVLWRKYGQEGEISDGKINKSRIKNLRWFGKSLILLGQK